MAMFTFSSLGFVLTARAETNTSQSAQIAQLMQLITQLQAQLAQMQRSESSAPLCIQIFRMLLLGSADSTSFGEVSKLQQFLKKGGYYTHPQITGYYGPVTQQAVKAWQNQENFYEASGVGIVGNASRAKISESCNLVTIDQRSIKSQSNKFKLSGTAKDVDSIFVALVYPYTSQATDWHSAYTTGSYVAFTGDTKNKVVGGKWIVDFEGIKSGNYEVRVYSSDDSTQKLLATQPLTVSGSDSVVDFTAGSKKTITLGVGQAASDGGVTVTLNNVFLTDGLNGLPRASFIIQSNGLKAASYSGGPGDYLPDGGGGITDNESPTGRMRVKINSISQSMNTVTFTVEAPKGPGDNT